MVLHRLPKVTLSHADRQGLAHLVALAASDRHPVAAFLQSEIERAEVVGDDEVKSVVMNSWVTYRIDRAWPVQTRKLVYPQDCTSRRNHLSVLSPEGAALIGLDVGSRMPYRDIEGASHVVSVEDVCMSAPVLPLFPLTRNVRWGDDGFDDDPGPSAA